MSRRITGAASLTAPRLVAQQRIDRRVACAALQREQRAEVPRGARTAAGEPWWAARTPWRGLVVQSDALHAAPKCAPSWRATPANVHRFSGSTALSYAAAMTPVDEHHTVALASTASRIARAVPPGTGLARGPASPQTPVAHEPAQVRAWPPPRRAWPSWSPRVGVPGLSAPGRVAGTGRHRTPPAVGR